MNIYFYSVYQIRKLASLLVCLFVCLFTRHAGLGYFQGENNLW